MSIISSINKSDIKRTVLRSVVFYQTPSEAEKRHSATRWDKLFFFRVPWTNNSRGLIFAIVEIVKGNLALIWYTR